MFVNSLEELDLVLKLLPNCLEKSLELVNKDKLVVNKEKLVLPLDSFAVRELTL
jgi:hypothetical protein